MSASSSKMWRVEHPEESREYNRRWFREHKDEIYERRRERYHADEEVRRKNIDTATRWRKENPEKRRAWYENYWKERGEQINKEARERRENDPKYAEKQRQKNKDSTRRLKIEVMTHYGRGDPKCECCGENMIEFLTIDHPNNDGGKERARLGKAGEKFYRHLKVNGYPEGYRVLCLNCNLAIGFYGYCPHQKQEE